MPGVYREKECPKCGVTHRKKGNFCSQSCASSYNTKGRVTSEETKAIKSRIQSEHLKTPEGLANMRIMSKAEDFAMVPPDIRSIDDYEFLDNYPRSEL